MGIKIINFFINIVIMLKLIEIVLMKMVKLLRSCMM